jgi:hypothetical protein
MSKHTLKWNPQGTLKVSGVIDEDTRFDDVVAGFGVEAEVDFSGVTRINSCGVRQWTKAVKTTGAIIRYVNVPSLIVDQISMVPEFLGAQGRVVSFDARFVCPDCSNEETARLQVGVDVHAGSATAPRRPCPRCGTPADLDHNPDVYLEFLLHVQ